MASGRKHASFRHRSQSDNGVIIELTPLWVGGCISLRLLPCLGAAQRLPSLPPVTAGPCGRCPPVSLEEGGQWGSDVVHPLPWVGTCLHKVSVRCIGDLFYGKRAGLSDPANGRSGRGPVAWVVLLGAGVSGVPDSRKGLLEESGCALFCCL